MWRLLLHPKDTPLLDNREAQHVLPPARSQDRGPQSWGEGKSLRVPGDAAYLSKTPRACTKPRAAPYSHTHAAPAARQESQLDQPLAAIVLSCSSKVS
jgi:hypothetical protein